MTNNPYVCLVRAANSANNTAVNAAVNAALSTNNAMTPVSSLTSFSSAEESSHSVQLDPLMGVNLAMKISAHKATCIESIQNAVRMYAAVNKNMLISAMPFMEPIR